LSTTESQHLEQHVACRIGRQCFDALARVAIAPRVRDDRAEKLRSREFAVWIQQGLSSIELAIPNQPDRFRQADLIFDGGLAAEKNRSEEQGADAG
jgi:hypothetical protein